MNQKTIERPSLSRLHDMLTALTGSKYKIHANSGHQECRGPCPTCGGRDRFQCWIDRTGIVAWTCSYCPKPHNEKRLFEILGLEHDGYTPRPARKIIPAVPDESMLQSVKIDYKQVQHWHSQGFDKAMAYFEPYGIDVCTADDFMLGYVDYTNKEGVRIAGYTIPNFYPLANNNWAVKSVHVRRDDAVASPEMDKYHAIYTSNLRGVFNTRVVNTPDGKYRAPLLDALFICEAEKCVMSLMSLFRRYHLDHVAAIGYHPELAHDYYFDRIVSNATKIIVIQDNEPEKTRVLADGTVTNPGLDRALKVHSLVKNRPSYIITPKNHKQISDLIKAEGQQAALNWLSSESACRNLF